MAVAIDTLAYARKLQEAGFSAQQAEGQAEALAAAMTDSLATKQDLRELETRIDARFTTIDLRFEHLERHMDTRLDEMEKRLDARFDGKIADLERRMTLRLGGLMMAGVVVFSALNRLG